MKMDMMNQKLYAVIVLYNKNYSESETYNTIKDTKDLQIIVCDNSTKEMGNAVLNEHGVWYVDMQGNKGLSKAYNRAIALLQQKEATGYLCIFDDDTKIPSEYFSAIQDAAEKTDADVYLPLVFDVLGYMSPCKLEGYKARRIDELNEITKENISGINSGMAVNLRVFDNYRYDEMYFLDCIDHAFMREMKRRDKKIEVLENVSLYQNFSFTSETTDKKAAKNRYNILKKDFSYFCSDSLKGRIYAFMVLMKYRIALLLFGRMNFRKHKPKGENHA